MDTTAEVAPFRLLSFSLRNKQALVIPPVDAHSAVAPHLEETPADTPMPDTEVSEIDGKINEIGKLEAHVHYVFRGDEELLLRSVFRRVPEANWQRVVENVNAGIGGDITNLKVSDPAATREPFTLSYDVSRVNFLDWSKKKTEMFLPLVAVQPAGCRTKTIRMQTRSLEAWSQGGIYATRSSWNCRRNIPRARRCRFR